MHVSACMTPQHHLMQTLGLADSTPRSESRWRALFWPSIRNDADFDYVTHQGFWICLAAALTNLIRGLLAGDTSTAIHEALFFFFAALGVRQRSRVAGLSAFVAYLLRGFVVTRSGGTGFGFTRVLFLALLFANVRGNWLSHQWPRDPNPLRLAGTWRDKLSDQLPAYLWPRTRIVFYVFATAELALLTAALVTAP